MVFLENASAAIQPILELQLKKPLEVGLKDSGVGAKRHCSCDR